MREFESEDADQRARELARIQGVLKREVAQGEAAARVELRDLLSTARASASSSSPSSASASWCSTSATTWPRCGAT